LSVAQPLVQASLIGEAIDRGPVAVFVTDEAGRYVAVNQYACDLLGYTRAELLEKPAQDVVPGSDVAAHMAELAASRRLAGRVTLARRDGSTIDLDYRSSETTIAGLTFYVSVGWLPD
jgi:PAS domain S-box-containing protein